MEGFEKKSTGKNTNNQAKPRIQAGNIHFCVRGNCRKIIFLEDEDKIEFLRRCKRACALYDTQIEAFVIMDNHVHLQLITTQVTNFATWLLRGYSFWYNRKYSLSDKLFRTPFMSYCKFSDEWRLSSIFYILANPVKAGMCDSIKDYKWSSYHLMYMNRSLTKNHINIETSFIYKNFKSSEDFDTALNDYIISQNILDIKSETDIKSEIDINNNKETSATHYIDSNYSKGDKLNFNTRNRVPTYEVIRVLNKLLGIKTLHTLNLEEQKKLIITLKEQTGASFVQLSKIFDENYEYIRRIFK